MSIFSLRSRFSFGKRLFCARRGRGFTVVELLVVVAIITILTALILFQHRRFDSSTLLRSLTYSVALSMRQAQIYGTSVRQFGNAAGSFGYSYGIYFTNNPTCTVGTSCYFLFADVNGDTSYSASEKVQAFNLGSGYSIKTYCGIAGVAMTCSAACPSTLPTGITSCTANTLTSLTVYFKRPNPDAYFATTPSAPYSGAYIQIVSPAGGTNTRSVMVYITGQITVNPLLGS